CSSCRRASSPGFCWGSCRATRTTCRAEALRDDAGRVSDERLFIVAYDISDQRRWRRVFKVMHGYGEWLQLSVFQCRLSRRRRAELATRLRELVKTGEDHVLVIDIGPADKVELAIESIGRTIAKIEREATVI